MEYFSNLDLELWMTFQEFKTNIEKKNPVDFRREQGIITCLRFSFLFDMLW